MATSTVENYLKAILRLEEDAETELTVGGIAEILEVTPGTVSAMMRHLSDEGLIDYVPRRSVTLLPKGRAQAMQVVRRHRLIETFLVEVMKLDWAEVHVEAEVLEHVISDRLLRRMDEMLGHPSHDPHGDPIPDAEGNIQGEDLLRLADAREGPFRVVRVEDSDPRLLEWVQENRLLPGTPIQLTGRDSVAGLVEIRMSSDGSKLQLGEKVTESIFVASVEN